MIARFICWLLGHPEPRREHPAIRPSWWTCERCGAELLYGKPLRHK